jgi:catechol 2,3-dioxygenase-like lactoylglutathione lyase family enzyme
MDVDFGASVAPIMRDADAARSFYRDALGLSFEGEEGGYLFTRSSSVETRRSSGRSRSP